ncbi:MAG TPA: hypothetical protein VF487_01365 [Chitinophagaceae bacterium]
MKRIKTGTEQICISKLSYFAAMKKLLVAIVLVNCFIACNETDRQLTESTEDDINTATTFLRATLDEDYTKARSLLVNDSLNMQDMDVYERLYKERTPAEEKTKYRGASIVIHEARKVDSLTSIINYSNSYKKEVDSLKVIKMNGKWLVDLKFVFKQQTDSLP